MSDIADPVAAWHDVLARYRAVLAEQRIVLGDAASDGAAAGDLPRFVAPARLPPMPLEVREEARQLDAETAELLAHARELLAGMTPPSAAPVHRSVLASPSPSQMDTRL